MSAPGATPTRDRGEYLQTGDVRTYFEVHGTGEPLVLLHGGLCTVETLDGLTPLLAERFRVVTPERRGHGRTADVDGPISFRGMADDTAALLDQLEISGAPVVGFSDGAAVAAYLALRRPDLVSRLVLIGEQMNPDGFAPGVQEAMADITPHLPPMLVQLYGAASPDGPEHFAVIVEKVTEAWQCEPDISLEQLATIGAPCLFMMGDNDMVTLAHGDAVRRAIPGSQLAVVPGATHGLPFEKPEIVARLTLDFLAGR